MLVTRTHWRAIATFITIAFLGSLAVVTPAGSKILTPLLNEEIEGLATEMFFGSWKLLPIALAVYYGEWRHMRSMKKKSEEREDTQ